MSQLTPCIFKTYNKRTNGSNRERIQSLDVPNLCKPV